MTQITVLTIPGIDYYEHMFGDHEITYKEMRWWYDRYQQAEYEYALPDEVYVLHNLNKMVDDYRHAR